MLILPVLQIIVYSFTLWLGLYLLARHPQKAGMRYAGLGLVAYALGLGLDMLLSATPDLLVDQAHWRTVLLLLPSLFWYEATLYLLPDTLPVSRNARDLPAGVVLYVVAVIAIFEPDTAAWVVLFAPAGLLLYGLLHVWRALRTDQPDHPIVILLTATIFFLLGLGAMLIPPDILSSDAVLIAIGGDMALLGYAIAALDAYDEGEALLPDFLRSLGASALAALLFGGQVALIAAIQDRISPLMLLLLLATVTTAIALQTFSGPLQTLLDQVILARFPKLRRERADLRAAAEARPRVDDSFDVSRVSEQRFARLTRRALSNMGDLRRLASSPLTRLSIIDQRLAEHGRLDNTLERANELKALLTESIARLKPRGDAGFGTSDEWRYYNALYFPYVVGIKPYSRRSTHHDLDDDAQSALEWFRTYVPERTLYNWQNAAAKLVAQDLREITVIEELAQEENVVQFSS